MGWPIFKSLCVIHWMFLILPSAEVTSDQSCNYYQELIFGEKYNISSPNFPMIYSGGTSCIWDIRTVSGTKIYLSCIKVDLPVSPNCQADRLAISLTGNKQFQDSKNYCGSGSFSLISQSTALTMGLFSSKISAGGKFICSVTTIKDTSTKRSEPTESQLTNCDCGWKQMTRIVGGHETGINEYSFMTALILKKKLWCGASIISDRFVLTAGHCVIGHSPNDLFIIAGDHNLNTGSDTNASALYKINAYEIHPQYEGKAQNNDIAILQTTTKIIFNPKVGPICLPFRFTNYDFAGQDVVLLGWGQIEFTGELAKSLQEVKVNVISNQQCSSMQDETITSGEMCTYSDEGKDSCQSDSGGPVVWLDTSTARYQLVGIISHGVGCGSPLPSINTRVTEYIRWIIQRTGASYCIK